MLEKGILLAALFFILLFSQASVSGIETSQLNVSEPGSMIVQEAPFNGSKTISTVSLFLNVSLGNKTIMAEGWVASFKAANFQESRDSWVFQPVIQWRHADNFWNYTNWTTSGITINNTLWV